MRGKRGDARRGRGKKGQPREHGREREEGRGKKEKRREHGREREEGRGKKGQPRENGREREEGRGKKEKRSEHGHEREEGRGKKGAAPDAALVARRIHAAAFRWEHAYHGAPPLPDMAGKILPLDPALILKKWLYQKI